MGERGREDGQEAEEYQRPGRVVAGNEVIDVDAALRGHHKVDHEDQGQQGEHDGRLVGLHGGPLVHQAGGHDLDAAHDGGRGREDDEAEEEAGPEPVVVHACEGRLSQGHPDEPEALARDGAGHVGVFDVLHVEALLLMRHADQREHEEHAEDGPDEVANGDDSGIPRNN